MSHPSSSDDESHQHGTHGVYIIWTADEHPTSGFNVNLCLDLDTQLNGQGYEHPPLYFYPELALSTGAFCDCQFVSQYCGSVVEQTLVATLAASLFDARYERRTHPVGGDDMPIPPHITGIWAVRVPCGVTIAALYHNVNLIATFTCAGTNGFQQDTNDTRQGFWDAVEYRMETRARRFEPLLAEVLLSSAQSVDHMRFADAALARRLRAYGIGAKESANWIMPHTVAAAHQFSFE